MEGLSTNVSRTLQNRLVLPPDTNHLGTIFGGTVLSYIDEIAAIAAMKHSRMAVVTASIDSVNFLSSAVVGDILTLEAVVISTGRTSMEVFVKVESENLKTCKKTLTTTSILTMVAKDEQGVPVPVAGIVPESIEEWELFNTAEMRRQRRLEMRQK
ncbi:acyl-CoA thioesterase [Bacillus sp. ISL-35]|uniref:acyl-CoA thioesterase n=1 Tax=Bacillus sp. ISL-35 TaxID=2819122 RepID=UPI001BEA2400|nr:acyl-CoA thioesterase [Bacillus sp. ISL-35]MBT2680389.1 acyl-CoA thioesterase [Bacillus sp. ISL-35]MBT2704319.1 acyl-CoA thioesterase [Chryseobacterium sp. ISL-80]